MRYMLPNATGLRPQFLVRKVLTTRPAATLSRAVQMDRQTRVELKRLGSRGPSRTHRSIQITENRIELKPLHSRCDLSRMSPLHLSRVQNTGSV